MQDRAMLKWIISGFALIGALIGVNWFASRPNPTSAPITVSVTLINHCPLPNGAFMLQNLQNGRYTKFINDVATVTAPKRTKHKLVLSPKYPDVAFDGTEFLLRSHETVTADCSMGEKERGIMGGLQGQFSK